MEPTFLQNSWSHATSNLGIVELRNAEEKQRITITESAARALGVTMARLAKEIGDRSETVRKARVGMSGRYAQLSPSMISRDLRAVLQSRKMDQCAVQLSVVRFTKHKIMGKKGARYHAVPHAMAFFSVACSTVNTPDGDLTVAWHFNAAGNPEQMLQEIQQYGMARGRFKDVTGVRSSSTPEDIVYVLNSPFHYFKHLCDLYEVPFEWDQEERMQLESGETKFHSMTIDGFSRKSSRSVVNNELIHISRLLISLFGGVSSRGHDEINGLRYIKKFKAEPVFSEGVTGRPRLIGIDLLKEYAKGDGRSMPKFELKIRLVKTTDTITTPSGKVLSIPVSRIRFKFRIFRHFLEKNRSLYMNEHLTQQGRKDSKEPLLIRDIAHMKLNLDAVTDPINFSHDLRGWGEVDGFGGDAYNQCLTHMVQRFLNQDLGLPQAYNIDMAQCEAVLEEVCKQRRGMSAESISARISLANAYRKDELFKWANGELRMLSSIELADKFGVSRNTIVTVLKEARDNGLDMTLPYSLRRDIAAVNRVHRMNRAQRLQFAIQDKAPPMLGGVELVSLDRPR